MAAVAQAVDEQNAALASTKGTALAKTNGIAASLSRGLLQARQHRTPLAKHEATELEHLEDLVRLHAANPKALAASLHLQPFADEAVRQAAVAHAGDSTESAARSQARAAFRAERRASKAAVRAALEAQQRHVGAVHAAAQQRRHAMEAADLRVEMTLAEKDKARRKLATSVAAMRVNKEIDAFEDSLARSGGSPTKEGSGSEGTGIKAYSTHKERMQRDANVRQSCHDHKIHAAGLHLAKGAIYLTCMQS